MRLLAAALLALTTTATAALAGPEETALMHFQKGCLSAPMQPDKNYAYFNQVPGFRPWGPMKSYQKNRYQQGGELKMGIFNLVNEGKKEVFLVSKSFKPHMSMCVVEFTPSKSFEDFTKQGWSLIRKQRGFKGELVGGSKKGKAASMGTYRIEMVPVLKGKKFQILIRKL